MHVHAFMHAWQYYHGKESKLATEPAVVSSILLSYVTFSLLTTCTYKQKDNNITDAHVDSTLLYSSTT